MTFQDLGLIPRLSRPGKCDFWITRLPRICTNPVLHEYHGYGIYH